FGEYELFPSLIGLSPLPSGHPETFQRLSVRSSSTCYRTFNLPKGRSQGIASTSSDCAPCSDSLSLRLLALSHQPFRTRVTSKLIMQKARRHEITPFRPLLSTRFQFRFTPLYWVLFTFH